MAEKTQPTPEVMDLTLVCQSFPRLPDPLIPRDNLLNTVELMFGDEIELVMIEGGRRFGKNYASCLVCTATCRSYILGVY
jgi:hypothetical protein